MFRFSETYRACVITSLLSFICGISYKENISQSSPDPCFTIPTGAQVSPNLCNTAPKYDPDGPLVYCSYLPEDFYECDEPATKPELPPNSTQPAYGCSKAEDQQGGTTFAAVEVTTVKCRVLSGIECYGNRTFFKHGVPCVRYSGHRFLSTLVYSVLLGFLGVDRFCLRHTGTAIGKLLTLGGVGVWWIVDVVLLITGGLTPEDGSFWLPYY